MFLSIWLRFYFFQYGVSVSQRTLGYSKSSRNERICHEKIQKLNQVYGNWINFEGAFHTWLSFRPVGEVYKKYSIECNASVTIVFHMLIKLTEYKLSQLFFYRWWGVRGWLGHVHGWRRVITMHAWRCSKAIRCSSQPSVPTTHSVISPIVQRLYPQRWLYICTHT